MPQINKYDSEGYVVENQCQTCARRKGTGLTCEAFSSAIPARIFMGAYDHTYPYNLDGQDDKGLTWIPKESISAPSTKKLDFSSILKNILTN